MIPIVFACDIQYVAPTYVAISSALQNKFETTHYHVYILCPKKFDGVEGDLFEKLSIEYNTPITIVEMGNKYESAKMKIEHITTPTYYRLSLPELLKDEEKCIYLDSDIIVRGDLQSLFDIQLGDCYLGGVLSEGIQEDRIYARELCKRIGLKNVSTYINAGVLLLNLELLRKDKMVERWNELVPKSFPAQDQDILNLTCFGRIRIIKLKYNAMTKCRAIINGGKTRVYKSDEVREAIFAPVIVHYADIAKPWSETKSFCASLWWNEVENIVDCNAKEYVYQYSNKKRTQQHKNNHSFKRIISRFLQVIGLYGYLKRLEDNNRG